MSQTVATARKLRIVPYGCKLLNLLAFQSKYIITLFSDDGNWQNYRKDLLIAQFSSLLYQVAGTWGRISFLHLG